MSQTTPSTRPGLPGGPTRPDRPEPGDRPPGAGRRPHRPTTLVVALVVAVAVIAALVAVLVVQRDGEDDAVTAPTTTDEPATTRSATTGPTTAPTTTATVTPAPDDTATAVFPDPSSPQRFDDPVAAARAFAVDFVGFTDPVLGELMRGDARSGEVEVRPLADGPVTTVFVRQLGPDDTWWVLGSATGGIVLDTPASGDTVTSPVTLAGRALAFEGNVEVEVREDGAREPIGTGVVTGGGDVERPFDGEVEFSAPTADRGALVLLTRSAEDGRVWQAAVTRVQFG
jgi:Immunoglobulin-like domain of bacterial spore germination